MEVGRNEEPDGITIVQQVMQSGKVIAFDVRSKLCKTCEKYEGKKTTVPAHDCSKNWFGSSKAMESDMALSMVHKLEEDDFKLQVLHADNDSSTMAKLRGDFPDLEKKDDQNHTKKGISKSLYALSKKYKVLQIPEVIPYLTRCLMYPLMDKEKNVEDTLKTFDSIIPHVFGDHSKCSESDEKWCTFRENPATFRLKNLPDGKPLEGEDLRRSLEELVLKYKYKVGNLKNMGSTQSNESFNSMVARKAPKNRHYGGSSSLRNRVSAAVLQKNEGYSYLVKVNQASLLSPGLHTLKLASKFNKDRKSRRKQQKTTQYKRKRMQLQKQRRKKQRVSNVKEGKTYESNMAISNDQVDEVIPDPLAYTRKETLIIFDLETTGLSRNSDIIQIAAAAGNRVFQNFIYPRCEISPEASNVTGMTYNRDLNSLSLNGEVVEAKSIQEGLLNFLEFVQSFENPILVGHNCKSFDIPVLCNRLFEFNLYSAFCKSIKGFIDTLHLAKRVIPKEDVKGSYKQENLLKVLMGISYKAHIALEDVNSLQSLVNEKLKSYIKDQDVFSLSYHSCKYSYTELVAKKICSKALCEKLARSGLSLAYLKIAASRDPKGAKFILQCHKVSAKQTMCILNHLNKEE